MILFQAIEVHRLHCAAMQDKLFKNVDIFIIVR